MPLVKRRLWWSKIERWPWMPAVKQSVHLFQMTWMKGKANKGPKDEKEGVLGCDFCTVGWLLPLSSGPVPGAHSDTFVCQLCPHRCLFQKLLLLYFLWMFMDCIPWSIQGYLTNVSQIHSPPKTPGQTGLAQICLLLPQSIGSHSSPDGFLCSNFPHL